MLCRAIGCNVACHARCLMVDQDKWPSVMGDYNGVTLRKKERRLLSHLGVPRARG